ncbi:MAG: penicillin acylase family protein [Maricaulaceae bacterium]
MTKLKKILCGGVAVLGLGVMAAGVMTWSPLPDNPNAESLMASAAGYDVEILRDEWGVPHIIGARDIDASFGLGYAHAEDDFETLQVTVAATRGVLGRYQGKDAAVTDYLVSLMGIWDRIDRRYALEVPEDVKETARAFVAGVNLYAAHNPDEMWGGLFPITEQDITAGFMFKTPFFYGFDKELLALFGDERMQEVSLDPSAKDAFHVGPSPMTERGSNAFAVSPERSGDGVTRLFINSHQPLTGPVAWYEAHMISREGMDIQGGLFPGTPVVLSGFNKHLGWANTVSEPDLADVFVLTVNPDNEDQYKLDGEWVDFDVSYANIKVGLFGPFAIKVKRKVLRSVHGPVVESPHGTYAIKYAGMNELNQLQQYMTLGKATNLDEFMAAMALHKLPSINYVYADKDGQIAFVHNGQFPDRKAGWNWKQYLPGDRSDLNWDRYLPFSDVPRLINPESGFLWNANNDPTHATDGPDDLTHDMFTPEMGLQKNMTSRAMRMEELTVDGTAPMTRKRLLEIKFDTKYAKTSKAAKVQKDVLSMDWSGDERLAAAAAHLAEWDLGMEPDSRHAALGSLTTLRYVTAKYTGIEAPANDVAFREAVAYLQKHYGKIDPQWGEVNRHVRGDVNVPIGGGPDILRAVYPAEIRDDGQLHNAAGDSYIALVEWDENGNQTAEIIQPFGSAIERPDSPHYADQAKMYADRKFRKAYTDEATIRANATRAYDPKEK